MAAHFSFKEDSNKGQNEIFVLDRWVQKEGERNENLFTAPHIVPQRPVHDERRTGSAPQNCPNPLGPDSELTLLPASPVTLPKLNNLRTLG